MRHTLALLVLLVAASGCESSRSLISGNARLYAYTWAEESALGAEVDAELAAEMGLYDDPALTAYVTRVGEAVLAPSHLRRPEAPPEVQATAFTFRVLDSPDINAFALPGGFVYVTRGLLAHLSSEAELAVVLGHEVGHVAGRHASQRMLEATLFTAGVLGASAIAELIKEDAGQYVAGAGLIGTGLLLMSHSRGHESESDALGVEYAARAGYRAAEGAAPFAIFRRLRERDGGLPTFLSTHPDPGRREAAIPALAAEWAAQGVAQTRSGAEDFLAHIEGLVLGPDPRQGYVAGGRYVLPPAALRFDGPAGWAEALAPAQVTFASPDEGAALRFRRRDERTAQAAVAQIVADYAMTVEAGGADRVAGGPAYVVTARMGADAEARRVRVWAVERPDGVYMLVGAARPDVFEGYRAAFDQAARSLRAATAAEASVAPVRLRVVRASRAAPFRSYLPASLPPGLSGADLALLNGLDLEDVVPAGRTLKLPR